MLKENSAKEIGELLMNVSAPVSAKAYAGVSASSGFAGPEPYEDSKRIAEIKNRCKIRFRFRFIDKVTPENYR